jgi:hypothetical protein
LRMPIKASSTQCRKTSPKDRSDGGAVVLHLPITRTDTRREMSDDRRFALFKLTHV